METYYARMIAAAARECDRCGDPIDEGTMYYRAKNDERVCGGCVDYEREQGK